MKYRNTILALVLALALCGVPAMASSCNNGWGSQTIFPFNPSGCPELPRLPHTFGGCVYVNGEPAPEGTRVCVSGQGVSGNCIETDAQGCFGQGTFDQKLTAQGIGVPGGMLNVPEGTQLWFTVNGIRAKVCIGSSCVTTLQYHTGHHNQVTIYVTVPVSCCGR